MHFFCRWPINNEERIHSKFIYGNFRRINQGPSRKMIQRTSIAPSWTITFVVFCHFIQQEIIRCIKQSKKNQIAFEFNILNQSKNKEIQYQNDYNYFNAMWCFFPEQNIINLIWAAKSSKNTLMQNEQLIIKIMLKY